MTSQVTLPVPSRAVAPARSRGVALLALITALLGPGAARAGVDLWTFTGPPDASAPGERLDVFSLALDPRTPQVQYVIAAAPFRRPEGPDDGVRRLWRTSDGGLTWSRWLPELAAVPRQVAADPHRPGRIYVATDAGLYAWDDASGVQRRVSARPLRQLFFDAADPDLFFAADATTIFRSRDAGRRWHEVLSFPPPTTFDHYVIHAVFADPALPGRVYASVELFMTGAETGSSLYRSDDAGETWVRLPALPGFDARLPAERPDGGPSPLVSMTYRETYRSVDGGTVWVPTDYPGAVLLALPGEPSTLYAVGDTVLFRSRDGGATWTALDGIESGGIDWRAVLTAHPAAPEHLFVFNPVGTPLFEAHGVGARPLALHGGRFVARAAWNDTLGLFGAARPKALSPEAGVFTLPGRQRLLAAVEVLDGASADDPFPLLGAGLLPMSGIVTVIDCSTGQVRDLAFPPGRALSYADAETFRPGPPLFQPPLGCPGHQAAVAPEERGLLYAAEPSATLSEAPAASATCVPSATSLCLLGDRYRVEVFQQDGVSGPRFAPLAQQAAVAPLLWESGIAWFDDPDVPSLVVQLVDGEPQNGSVWVLIGGLSEEGYVVRVWDTVTGAARRYVHLPGPPASVADLEAF